MADLKAKIKDVVVGDDISIYNTLDNVGTGQSLTKAWLTVKEEHWDTDADALFQKEITTTNTAGQGHIEDDGTGDDVATVRFDITAAETILLHPYFEYVYDIQVLTNTGKIYTPEFGKFLPVPSVTDDDS